MVEMKRCRLVMMLLATVTVALGTGDTRVRLRLQPPLAIRSDNRRIFSSHQPRSYIYLYTYLLEQNKLRNADILIQQETIRTNPIVSSHHHCLIFIKYI